MEEKLFAAAAALPETAIQLTDIKEKIRPRKVIRFKPWVRVAAVMAAVVLCATTVFAITKGSYGLWSGIHSNAYADVQILNWKYDYCFPETLCGLPFSDMSTYYGAPHGATHLEALLSPTYALHNVDYGDYSGMEQEDGTILSSGNRIAIAFGTTENENWRYHFSVAEDGSCGYEGVQPGSQSTMEYKGYTLHLYTVSYPSVRWEDPEKSLVITVTCYGCDSPDEVVKIAKELIDLNS